MVERPLNERQARELVPLLEQPEQLRETWAEVRALHAEPTASDVREVVGRGSYAKTRKQRAQISD